MLTMDNRMSVRLAVLMFAVLLIASGCSDDDPVTPVPLPEEGYLATSPDSLMALWQTALTTLDSTMYGDMYDPDFRFHFSDGDMSEYQLLTDHMTRDETVQTGWNMFSGQEVTNWVGVNVFAVARIIFHEMTQNGASGSRPSRRPVPTIFLPWRAIPSWRMEQPPNITA